MTRLALAQRRHLEETLARREISLRSVVIADDDNLDIAGEHGCDTIEMTNHLAAKVNAGFRHACEAGADYVCFVGSDDWLHEDFFSVLDGQIVSGREIFVVDLENGRGRRLRISKPQGVAPWLIPRGLLEQFGFTPIPKRREELMWGIDGAMYKGLGVPRDIVFNDPHDACRVDFKTDLNLTAYSILNTHLGVGEETHDPWSVLERHYPADLVAMGRDLHARLAA